MLCLWVAMTLPETKDGRLGSLGSRGVVKHIKLGDFPAFVLMTYEVYNPREGKIMFFFFSKLAKYPIFPLVEEFLQAYGI